MPSGGFSGQQLADELATDLNLPNLAGSPLAEAAGIISNKVDRRALIKSLRKFIVPLKPTRGLLNLPFFDWREIYTTNYDTLIEQAYQKIAKAYRVLSSNFDLTTDAVDVGVHINKLHGTIEKDIVDGDNSRIIITEADYDLSQQYRDGIYDKFRDQLNRSQTVIIGQSLVDPDLRETINRALRLKKEGTPGKIYLLIHQKDEDRAKLFEDRGLTVCFGGVDDFCHQMTIKAPPAARVWTSTGDPLDAAPQLRTTTTEVSHALVSQRPQVLQLFNGRPASYGDIAGGLTFERDLIVKLETQLTSDGPHIAVLLGAAGVGKTTLCRQLLARLTQRGLYCWEHDDYAAIDVRAWAAVADRLQVEKRIGVLFIDDCSEHLRQVNALSDMLSERGLRSLKLVLISNPPAWHPRVKAHHFS
jgi:hypothetical protein